MAYKKILLSKLVHNTEVALHRCSKEKVFWKCAANLQEDTLVEVRFQ